MKGPYYILNERQRYEAWGRPCAKNQTLVDIEFVGYTLKVNQLAFEAFSAFDLIAQAHNYSPTGTDTGFYNCRHMQHNDRLPWSVHAWAMAVDLNWLSNPAGSKLVTDIPRAMRDDILALRTNSGARVFRWGADWDWDGQWTDHSYVDAMHWECVAHPYDLKTGIKGFKPSKPTPPEDDWTKELIVALPTLREGDGFNDQHPEWRDDVRRMQACVAIGGVKAENTFDPTTGKPDGLFGPGTKNALVAYQGRNGLTADGICGRKSWTSLLGE